MKMGKGPLPVLGVPQTIGDGAAKPRVVIAESGAAHAGVDLDVEGMGAATGPLLERRKVADGGTQLELEAAIDPVGEQRRAEQDRPGDPGLPQLDAFLDRGDAVAPG